MNLMIRQCCDIYIIEIFLGDRRCHRIFYCLECLSMDIEALLLQKKIEQNTNVKPQNIFPDEYTQAFIISISLQGNVHNVLVCTEDFSYGGEHVHLVLLIFQKL